jgi:hypothetical protein
MVSLLSDFVKNVVCLQAATTSNKSLFLLQLAHFTSQGKINDISVIILQQHHQLLTNVCNDV